MKKVEKKTDTDGRSKLTQVGVSPWQKGPKLNPAGNCWVPLGMLGPVVAAAYDLHVIAMSMCADIGSSPLFCPC